MEYCVEHPINYITMCSPFGTARSKAWVVMAMELTSWSLLYPASVVLWSLYTDRSRYIKRSVHALIAIRHGIN